MSDRWLDILIDFERGARFPCPGCQNVCHAHDTSERVWRHLNFFGYEAYLHVRVPRTSCPDHGVKQAELPRARSNDKIRTAFHRAFGFKTKEHWSIMIQLPTPPQCTSRARFDGVSSRTLFRSSELFVPVLTSFPFFSLMIMKP